jgi:hypothetical protein
LPARASSYLAALGGNDLPVPARRVRHASDQQRLDHAITDLDVQFPLSALRPYPMIPRIHPRPRCLVDGARGAAHLRRSAMLSTALNPKRRPKTFKAPRKARIASTPGSARSVST